MFKILKFLKVLKITTCFGQYGHHQVLKSSGGNCCYFAVVTCVPLMRMCVVLGVLCSLLFFVACFVLDKALVSIKQTTAAVLLLLHVSL
jgi:hypothetical protein